MIAATIIVIAKAPVPGRVKTRLCPPCTDVLAAEIAGAAIADTLATIAAVPVARRVVALDGEPGPWLSAAFDVVPQVAGAFGARLAAAFAAVDGPAFLVGMDTPQLTRAGIERALHALLRHDVDAVLGPAADGGWWGMGLSRANARVFDGVPMSTAQTVAYQLRQMRALGLRTTILDVLRDVDDFDDALAVAKHVPGSAFARTVDHVARRIRISERV
ncbi:MAG: TIGR04282 family arsenosugar biosynthesis glycosyltransferase [Actinomycetota bacterium]